MKRHLHHYLKVWALTTLVLLGVVAAFNLLVDPFGAYRLIQTPWLDAHKPLKTGRIIKAEALRHFQPDVILLGSSKVELGIDPSYPAWGAGRIYNLGLPGAYFREMMQVLDYAVANGHPRHVVLFLDFFGSAENNVLSDEFPRSRFDPDTNALAYHSENLLGLDATKRSVRSILNLEQGVKPEHNFLGMRLDFPQNGMTRRQTFEKELVKTLSSPDAHNYRYDATIADRLRHAIRICAAKNIELTLVISPQHAIHSELYRALGTHQNKTRWLRDLTQAIAAEGNVCTLWDFSGYNELNTEPVSAADGEMRWYWESCHFKKELGNRVIERIQGVNSPETVGFGVRLDSTNLDNYLLQDEEARSAYVRRLPQDVKLVRQAMDLAADPDRKINR